MEHIAQGKRSDTLGHPHSRVSAPCKGKSVNPLCCYFYLIADLAVLKWNVVCIFVQHLPHVLKLLPFQGATAPTRDTQGVASLALGYGLHWAFSLHLLNPKFVLLVATPRLIEQKKRLERAETLSNQTYYNLPAILLAKHLFTPNDVGKSFLWGGHATSRHVVDSCVSIDERRVNFAYLGHGRIKVEVAIVNTLKYEYA